MNDRLSFRCKHLLLSVLLVGVMFQADGQVDSLIWFKYRALNNYADFTNDNIHALWNYHTLFSDLNKDLIRFQSARNAGLDLPEVDYPHEDYLSDAGAYKRLPASMFYFTLDNSDYLPPGKALQLNAHVEEIWKNTEAVEAVSLEIEEYIASKEYLNDPDLEGAFQMLDRAENHYQLIYLTSLDLANDLQSAYATLPGADPRDPFVQNGHLLKSVIDPCREILQAIRQDDPIMVEGLQLELEIARELYLETVGDKLNEVREYVDESSLEEPHIRYDFVLKQLDHFISYTKEYVETYDQKQRLPHGNSWFYYNNRMLNTYNRFGRGLVLQYNKYLDSTKVKLFKQIEAVSWMKTTRPEDLVPIVEEPIAQADDSLEIEDLVVEIDPIPLVPPAGEVETLEGYAYNNLVFLLDVSASMDRPGKLDLLKSSFKYLISLMRPEDNVAIVVYSGKASIVLPSTSGNQKSLLNAVIDSLESKGTSQVLAGVQKAYQVAERHFINGGNNKIILASDGAFDEDKKLVKLIRSINREDIALTVFYYNKIEKSEEKDRLQRLARAGKGNYTHIRIDNANRVMLSEAQKVQQ